MRIFKKTLAVLLVVCSILSVASCESKQTDHGQELCTAFCEDVKAGDTSKLITYISDGSVTEDQLIEKICPPDKNITQQEYLNAVQKTITYSMQDPVFDAESKISTIFLSWQIADLEDEAVKSASSITELEDVLASSSRKIITTNVSIDLSGETPKITNAKDVIDAVYEYAAGDYGVMPGTVADFYNSGDWVLAPKDVYINTNKISLLINFKPELFDYKFIPGIKYVVSRGEEALYTSDTIRLTETSLKLDFTAANH